jgi:hypothetical protein
MSDNTTQWFPEIMYEEDSKIPFVPVPVGETMPNVLFMFESRETGEYEPGSDGEPLPIIQFDLYQYANMDVLKSKLSPKDFDIIRHTLGLESVASAAQKGEQVTEKVKNTFENS